MKTINSINELQSFLRDTTSAVGFVPTMGALHKGHLSLIEKARQQNDIVVVSVFVNPTQFLVGEDLDKYPKTLNLDSDICQKAGVDILFIPNVNEIYKDDEVHIKAPSLRSYILEGFKRPSHFDGVLQVVLKLFNIVNPTNAYFGQKDAQQLSLIKQMVDNLFLNINIIACETIREDDGLALSSRNIYLSNKQRQEALKISQSLKLASTLIKDGCLDSLMIVDKMNTIMKGIDIEYIAVVEHNFKPLDTIKPNNTIILVAVKIGETRLIDNLFI